MKILLLMDNPLVPTGYGSTCRLTARELINKGHEVYAMAFNGGNQPEGIGDFFGIKIIANHARKDEPNNLYGNVATILKVESEQCPDIYFWHNDAYRFSYLQNLPKNILDKSVFWLPYEGDYADPLGPNTFGKCAAARFVTEHALKHNFETVKNMDNGVIYHAVDTSVFTPCENKKAAKAAKSLGIEDKFVVVRVDRHQPRKYWSVTIKAFARFAKGKDDVFLLAKCDPRDCTMWNKNTGGQDLEALAIENGLTLSNPKANKIGNIFFDDFFFDGRFIAQAFYHPADVFLTTTSGEGFGLTPAEAMACGLPVIYPDSPVLPEVVGDKAGLKCRISHKEWYNPLNIHYNVTSEDDVVARLEECYADWKSGGKKLEEMGKAAYNLASERYNHKIVYDKWDKLLRKVTNKKHLVTLITVLYNVEDSQIYGEDGINRLKDSIEQYVTHPYEWIIVDNGSPAREVTRKWIEQASKENDRIKSLYLNVNHGFAGAHNKALELAASDYFLLVNPDSEAINPAKHGLNHDFVKIMYDRMKSDPMIGIAGMKLMQRDDVMKGLEFPYFCCTMLTRTCMEAIKTPEGKYFDEKFWPAYYEDADVVFRAMSKNFKVVEQDVPFWHKSGGTNKHAIEGGANGRVAKALLGELERIQSDKILDLDFERKRGEILAHGMQSLINGNISYLNKKWGMEARSKIKVCWHTHIGYSVGFSQIAEGLIPKLHELGFDVYVNDWSNGVNVENGHIRHLIEKTKKALAEGETFNDAINIVCWLMESFADLNVNYKIGIAFCESTKVRESYLKLCNGTDGILTFSEFCRGVQKNSGFEVPLHVINPGVNETYLNYVDRSSHSKDKFTFMCVGVSQDRKDTHRLVEAFCEAFPKGQKKPPECEENFPLSCDQVELVIKSNNFGELEWIKHHGFDQRANVRAIFTGPTALSMAQKIYEETGVDIGARKDLSTDEMYNLYAECDCYIHPSHGEGIGMPILEAAATGCPVIFTEWSSPVEYLNANNSYPCSLSPYPGTTLTQAYRGAPGDNGLWANIHIGHMKHLMYEVIRERPKAMEKGRKAHEHIKENLTWTESAKKLMPLLFGWEEARKKKKPVNDFDPATFVKPEIQPVKEGDRVMIDVVTRDRQPYLGVLMTSLLCQTFKNWDIVIQIDDSDESVLKNHLIMSLLSRMEREGHGWRMIRSQRQGPHMAHDRSLQMTADDPNYKYKLICRIDDDIYVKPDFLEKLYSQFLADEKCEIAAVGGVYLDPKRSEASQMAPAGFENDIEYAGKIDHNVPWPYICPYPPGTKPREVEHLYSSFMYRVEIARAIGGYCKLFSQIGHREESDFTCRFFFAGYKQFIHPEAIGFHFTAPSGGIRSESITSKEELAHTDHKIYTQRLASWKRSLLKKNIEVTRVSMTTEKKKYKVLAVINGGTDVEKINEAVKYFSNFADDIYVTGSVAKDKVVGEKLRSVASTPDEVVALTNAILSQGDHDFTMMVGDKMRFNSEPAEVISLLDDSHDDYVFEVYKTYLPGNWDGMIFRSDETLGTTIGPEVRNQCLITRAKKTLKPTMERTTYSDVMVLEDERLTPVEGRSVMNNDLVRLADVKKVGWRKVCTYQFPEGRLAEPRYLDIAPEVQDLVSIIIPTPGRRNLLKKCINSIFTHTKTPFEIIIVDNGSTDGTIEMLENEEMALPRGKVIKLLKQGTNLGYQKAINIGLSKARGNFILFFNDDAWVEGVEPDGRDWLRVYMDELKANPKIGVVGPHGGISPALGSKILYFWCVMFRREVLDEVGPLDDVTFRNYGGDDDYCERLRTKGYEIAQKYTSLSHLMTCVPDEIKKPELQESRVKLIQKYGPRM